MSVTFRIHHDKDESVVETFDCQNGPECRDPTCHDCKGKGTVTFKTSKWEMNVANGNASTILNSLGFDCEYHGAINANAMLKAIASTSPDRMVRATVIEGNLISCGVGVEHAQSYLDRLKAIATEAARREELVIWG